VHIFLRPKKPHANEPERMLAKSNGRSRAQTKPDEPFVRVRSHHGSRMPELIRLADRNPQLLASAIVGQVTARAARDAAVLGLVLKPANGSDGDDAIVLAVGGSNLFQAAKRLTEWAQGGRGAPDDIASLILYIRAQIDGIDPVRAVPTGPLDPSTLHGAVIIAAGARLALVQGRAMTAVELAILAGVDEHTVRAAVKAGTLLALLGSPRPMRFAAEVARAYLYARGAAGGAAPEALLSRA
jgi:hypothetical protein